MTATIPSPAANGRQRKTLAHQLDRLDEILDGLGEALNESVAAAVRQAVAAAVRVAVEEALTEVLSRPELLRAALAAGTPGPASESAPGGPRLRRAWGWVTARVRGALGQVGRVAEGLTERTRQVLGRAHARAIAVTRSCERVAAGVATFTAATATAAVGAAWRRRVRLLAAAATGLATGTLSTLAGPVAAAVAAGLSSAALVLPRPAPRPLARAGAATDP